MTKRWLTLAALTVAAVAGAFSASAASATDPLTLDSGYVTDGAGVLSSAEEETVEARLTELSANSNADLFVVLVDDFSSPPTTPSGRTPSRRATTSARSSTFSRSPWRVAATTSRPHPTAR